MKLSRWTCAPILVIVSLILSGCEGGGDSGEAAFPEFRDANGNSINDHIDTTASVHSLLPIVLRSW